MTEPAHTVLWVVGEPGVGKTTFSRSLLASYGPLRVEIAKPKWTIFHPEDPEGLPGHRPATACAAVGSWKGDKFDGGDTVPPSDILPALGLYAERFAGRGEVRPYRLVLFDGAKFSNSNAIHFIRKSLAEAGTFLDSRLVCVHIVGPTSAAAGRAARVAAGARPQNESWVRGRRTAAANFADRSCYSCGVEVITINRDAGESWD